jgi:hypothetical protein
MRSESESLEGCDRKRGCGSVYPESNPVNDGPKWEMIEAGQFGTVEDLFAPAIDRVYRAIEKDIKNVCKN